MKLKTLKLFYIFAISLLAVACSGGGDLMDKEPGSSENPKGLTLSETSIEASVIGDTRTITLTASSAWSATTNATWVTCKPSKGEAGTHQVEITIKLNKTQASRTANVTFTSNDLRNKISVQQESSPYFVLPCEVYNISYTGGTVAIGGLSKSGYSINIPEKDRNWITAESNVLKIAYSNLSKKRESEIEIVDTPNNQTYKVKLIQDFKSGNSRILPLSEIKINGYNCPSDKLTSVADFLYSVNKNALTPSITAKIEFSGDGVEWITIGGDDTKIYSGDEVTINDITPGSTIKVFTYNSNSADMGENQLMITSLPIVTITTEEEIRDEPKVDCNFTLFDPEARTDDAEEKNLMYFESLGGIEYRGAGAQRYIKKPYNFKLYDSAGEKREAQLLNIRNDNSWILDAMFLDVAHMRTRVCFDIWNQFNKPYYVSEKPKAMSGTRGHHVEVFLNGEYRGLFMLTDRIDRKQYQIEQDGGYIYKAKGWTDACCLRGCQKPSNDDYYWNSADIEQEYPGEPEDGAPKFDYLADMITFVASSSKADFSAKFEENFDMNSIVDCFIFLNMIVAHDNIGRNTFWVLRNVKESKKFIHGLWDLDGTLGRTWNRFEENPNQGWVSGSFRIYQRIIDENPANIHQKIYDRWNEIKDGALAPSNFNQIVKKYAELMISSGARDREVKRWKNKDKNDRPNWGYADVYYDDVDQEIAYMQDWWQKRHTKLNSLINSLQHK
ncbi:MAG: CotH kinase family protein [Alistipes sp.]|nr:CotH kinase family protein [Alistipes sp.]